MRKMEKGMHNDEYEKDDGNQENNNIIRRWGA
jgi:hypothetical protein